MPENPVTKMEPELRPQSVILFVMHSEVSMLTSVLPSSVTAWRGDPATFLSITGGDTIPSLAHKKREVGGGGALLRMKIPVRVHGIQIHWA